VLRLGEQASRLDRPRRRAQRSTGCPLGGRGVAAVERVRRGMEGDVSDVQGGDDGDQRQDRRRERDPAPAGQRPLRRAAPAEEQERRAAGERRAADRGELPVPVERGVDEERRVATGRGRGERAAARAPEHRQRCRERGEQCREPHRAELGERLEVEVVRVARVCGDRAVGEPPALVARGAAACQGPGTHLAPRDAPVVGAAVAGERAEPAGQVALVRLERSREGAVGRTGRRPRRAHPDDDEAGCDDRERGERDPPPPAEGFPRSEPSRQRRGARAGRGEQGEPEQQRVPLARGCIQRGALLREGGPARREQEAHGGERRERCGCDDEARAPRLDGQQDGDADGEREPRAAAEREEERRHRDEECAAGRRARRVARRPGGEPEGEQRADRSEDAEPVPVADGPRELVAAVRVEPAESVRQEARPQRVCADRRQPGAEPAEQRRHRAPSEQEQEGREEREVEHGPLGLPQRRLRGRRPDGRERGPAHEHREAGERDGVRAAKRERRAEHNRAARREEQCGRRPAPRGREVAALRGREPGRDGAAAERDEPVESRRPAGERERRDRG
jgi:hypothetical protein